MTDTLAHGPLHVPAWIACPHCRAPNHPVVPEIFSAYFAQVPPTCPRCAAKIDWWDALVRAARDHFMLIGAFQLLGCTTTVVQVALQREKVITLDLLEAGVDPDAEILSANFTASGYLMPLRVHGNVPRHDPRDKKILLYGASHGREGADTGTVDVAVTWIVTADEEVSFRSLVEASRAYDLGKYDAAIVPANVAVEASISSAVYDWMLSFSNQNRTKEFLSNAATYSYQLNDLLPVVCHTIGMAPMPDPLRGQLNKLRGHRNDIAHRGAPEKPIDKNTAAEQFTAAVFGFHYARRLHNEIRRSQMNGRLPKR